MTFITRYGIKVHKKLLHLLNSKSCSPTVADPVCRFISYMFKKSPQLDFVIDEMANTRASF